MLHGVIQAPGRGYDIIMIKIIRFYFTNEGWLQLFDTWLQSFIRGVDRKYNTLLLDYGPERYIRNSNIV